ncbi:precorrin-2 C(20)-methyltransferase [Rhizobium sp. L1K21]|uniref:precorrin-2 C(20)-methyltransferase n=1 Tax=Rhizobium sp. L1K21 TaxID=2954933 RepID=UPI002093CDD8|nr:precorrin-2 C(20)-methyltransferase [Rhizobium sp. L1K21]MCO6185794.1 precorrin-2 C(20)-methyltransferase [Rhizobium sp. L1K21]
MSGKLYGLGLGPGDPELVTLKAHRILTSVPVIAYPAPDTGPSFAREIASQWITSAQLEIAMVMPMRVERYPAKEIYDQSAEEIARHLQAGSDVAVLCEGDPFFYGSFMYVFERLAGRFEIEIVPGVSSIMAGAAALKRPMTSRNDVLAVIPGPVDTETMRARIDAAGAVAIMKVGRHFARIRDLIADMGLMESAGYLERISLDNERIMPLKAVADDAAPYFSLILIYKGQEDWIASLPIETKA